MRARVEAVGGDAQIPWSLRGLIRACAHSGPGQSWYVEPGMQEALLRLLGGMVLGDVARQWLDYFRQGQEPPAEVVLAATEFHGALVQPGAGLAGSSAAYAPRGAE